MFSYPGCVNYGVMAPPFAVGPGLIERSHARIEYARRELTAALEERSRRQ
jgi:hypothetical protein